MRKFIVEYSHGKRGQRHAMVVLSFTHGMASEFVHRMKRGAYHFFTMDMGSARAELAKRKREFKRLEQAINRSVKS